MINKSRLISTLRCLWLKSPERNNVKKSARVSRGKYRCNHCKLESFSTKEIQIHHIEPVIPSEGFTTWDDYITRLFCNEEGLEAICKQCHDQIHNKK